jgi:hypothetical protein
VFSAKTIRFVVTLSRKEYTMFRFTKRVTASAAVALLGLAPFAKADTIKLWSLGVVQSGANYTYTFQVTEDNAGQLVSGTNTQTINGATTNYGSSFISLYDVGTAVTSSFSADVGTWNSPTVQLTGATPLDPTTAGPTNADQPLAMGVIDGATSENVTLVYNGSTVNGTSLVTLAADGNKLLGTLTITSDVLIAPGKSIRFASQDNTTAGVDSATVSLVTVAAPLPAAASTGLALLGGLGLLGGVSVLRRRRQMA